MEESWEDEHIFQDEMISYIENLIETPTQVLIDGRVISEGDIYDFIRWYNVVITTKKIFESFTKESPQWKKGG